MPRAEAAQTDQQSEAPSLAERPAGPSRRLLVAVLALGVVGVVQSLLVQPSRHREPFFDEQRYKLWASNVIERGFYGDTADQFTARAEFRSVEYRAYVPPGYVFFLIVLRKVFWSGTGPVRVAQAVLVGAAVVAASLAAQRVFGSAAAVSAGTLLVVTGVLADYAQFALSEVLAASMLIVALYVVLVARDRRSWILAAVSGGVLGYSILVRPQVLLLPPVIGLWCFFAWGRRRAGLLAAVAFVAGTIVVVAPWTVRNYVRLHTFVPVSTYTWINFWLVNHPGSDGLFRRPEKDIGVAAVRAIRAQGEVEQDRTWRRMAVRWVREHPRRAVTGWVRNGRRYVADPDPLISRWYRLRRQAVPRLDERWLLAAGLFAVALAAVLRTAGWKLVLPTAVVLYFLAFFCFFVPTPRFRVGMLPLVALLAGGAAEGIWRLGRRLLPGTAAAAA
jgi:4-amino-4-deoxy-L-arabinose transferase-like glycosyltransferase